MIDKIINEWTYQLDAGYPTKESDYEVLRSVLQETNMLSEQEIEQTILQAKGVNEKSDFVKDLDFELPKGSTKYLDFNDPDLFEQFIINEYAMEGQEFIGLQKLFEDINSNPQREQLMDLITDLNKQPLKPGEYRITGIQLTLYNLIKGVIKVPNGHYSELWFAIVFNGEVKGGVAGDSIVSDVDVGADGVSLKDYEKISTVDFGNLTADTAMLLKIAVNSFEMLTGMDINKSMTRDSINAVLENLDSEELKTDIRALMQISKDTEIKVIRRFVDKLQRFMPDGNPERIVENFCEQLDDTINLKLLGGRGGNVKWWGIISNGILYLETSDEVFQALRCRNNRISPAVNNFKGFHLFVSGTRINAAIKDLRAKQAEG